jgi:hypothetical protein
MVFDVDESNANKIQAFFDNMEHIDDDTGDYDNNIIWIELEQVEI